MNGIPEILLFFFIWIAIVLKYLNESTYDVVKDEFIIVGLKFPVFKGRGPTQDKNP